MLDWTFNLLNHQWIPWLTSGLLLIWGLGQWLAMHRTFFGPVRQWILDATILLENEPPEPLAFRASFPKVDQTLSENGLIRSSWFNYRKLLIIPEGGGAIQGSDTPNHFFNLENLIEKNADALYYRSVPGFLMGAGVFFTFIGLISAIYFAIQGTLSVDVLTSQTAFVGILNATFFKLITSFFGYFSALLFSWGSKRCHFRLVEKMDLFCQLLDERIERVTEAKLVHQQLITTKNRDEWLQEMVSRINHSSTSQTGQHNPLPLSLTPLLDVVHEETERLIRYLNEYTLEKLPESLAKHWKTNTILGIEALEKLATKLETSLTSLSQQELNNPLPDIETLSQNIRQEGERLIQANQQGIEKILKKLAIEPTTEYISTEQPNQSLIPIQSILGQVEEHMGFMLSNSVETLANTLMQSHQQHNDQMIQMASQLENAVTTLSLQSEKPVTLSSIEPLLETIREEGTRLIQSNENTITQLLSTTTLPAIISSPTMVSNTEQTDFLNRIVEKLEKAVVAMTERAGTTPLFPDLEPLLESIQQQGEQLVQAHERTVNQLLTQKKPSTDPLNQADNQADFNPALILDRMAKKLEETLDQLATKAATLPSPDMEPLVNAIQKQGEQLIQANQKAIEIMMAEMIHQLGGNVSNKEADFLGAIASKLDQAMITSQKESEEGGSKIANTLMPLIESVKMEQGKALEASQKAMVPILKEVSSKLADQRGEEMHLLERVAQEVNRSVDSLNKKIARATPLSLKSLIEVVREQGEKMYSGNQEIVQLLKASQQAKTMAITIPPISDATGMIELTDTKPTETHSIETLPKEVKTTKPATEKNEPIATMKQTASTEQMATMKQTASTEKTAKATQKPEKTAGMETKLLDKIIEQLNHTATLLKQISSRVDNNEEQLKKMADKLATIEKPTYTEHYFTPKSRDVVVSNDNLPTLMAQFCVKDKEARSRRIFPKSGRRK